VIVGDEAAEMRRLHAEYSDSPFFIRQEYSDGSLSIAHHITRVTVHADGTETRRPVLEPGLAGFYGDSYVGAGRVAEQDGSEVPVQVYQLFVKGKEDEKRRAHERFVEVAGDDGYEPRHVQAEAVYGVAVGETEDDRLYSVTYFLREKPSSEEPSTS
jgi:hypothetical protein